MPLSRHEAAVKAILTKQVGGRLTDYSHLAEIPVITVFLSEIAGSS
jgi:hypothetical protein